MPVLRGEDGGHVAGVVQMVRGGIVVTNGHFHEQENADHFPEMASILC